MPLNTRHWSIIGVLGIDVANRALGAICGHSVDVTTIDYASIGYTVIVGLADFIHTHFGNYVPSTQKIQITQQTTPSINPDNSQLTPDS